MTRVTCTPCNGTGHKQDGSALMGLPELCTTCYGRGRVEQ